MMTESCVTPLTQTLCPTDEVEAIAQLLLNREYAQALARAQSLVTQAPHIADSWHMLTHAQRNMGQLDAAQTSIARAIELEPNDDSHLVAQALVLDALVSAHRADSQSTLETLSRAIALNPRNAVSFYLRGRIYEAQGHTEQAQNDYAQAIAIDPQHERARFKLACLKGEQSFEAAPPIYVQQVFDRYAEHFEAHLVGRLQYCAPQVLAELFAPHAPEHPLDILDLGCGTGLAAPHFRPLARRLDGVDLSAAMLQVAAEKKLYDTLTKGDLLHFLPECSHAYDLAVAADVFCYIGNLAPVLNALGPRMRPSGYLLFTVESGHTADFVLQASGRYQHHPDYLERVAPEHGWRMCAQAERTLRTEHERPVIGQVVLLQKMPPHDQA